MDESEGALLCYGAEKTNNLMQGLSRSAYVMAAQGPIWAVVFALCRREPGGLEGKHEVRCPVSRTKARNCHVFGVGISRLPIPAAGLALRIPHG